MEVVKEIEHQLNESNRISVKPTPLQSTALHRTMMTTNEKPTKSSTWTTNNHNEEEESNQRSKRKYESEQRQSTTAHLAGSDNAIISTRKRTFLTHPPQLKMNGARLELLSNNTEYDTGAMGIALTVTATDDILTPLYAAEAVVSAAIQQLTEEQLLVEQQKRLLEQQEKSSYYRNWKKASRWNVGYE